MNSEIIVRTAQPGDAQRICEINRDSLGYDFPLDRTQARLKNILTGNDRIFVAIQHNEVIGYIHGSAYECTYCESVKNILALAVDLAYQGKGAGRKLLDALEEWARQDGSGGCASYPVSAVRKHTSFTSVADTCTAKIRRTSSNISELF